MAVCTNGDTFVYLLLKNCQTAPLSNQVCNRRSLISQVVKLEGHNVGLSAIYTRMLPQIGVSKFPISSSVDAAPHLPLFPVPATKISVAGQVIFLSTLSAHALTKTGLLATKSELKLSS